MKDLFIRKPYLISEVRQGIERECLRSDYSGLASTKPHAKELGSKLTHSNITTDYAENLLEFITSVYADTGELLTELEAVHAFTVKNSGEEILWPSSMPCLLPAEDEIPLADFGTSNTGTLKKLYRRGLGHRYGRSMQSIAGVHYNFSLSDNFWQEYKSELNSKLDLADFKSEQYVHLIRNFQRNKWLLIYLFGASPAVDKSFLKGKEHNLKQLDADTFYTNFGTSLRMGGLGYTSDAQSGIRICYDKISTYVKTLESFRLKEYPAYEKIPYKIDGKLQQLNSNLVQIDNEFYSTIRPKNIAGPKESALKALHLRGVEYIEVRLLDVDPYEKLGLSEDKIHFLHLFLLWCLTSESPSICPKCHKELTDNFNDVVQNGRDKNLKLSREGTKIDLSTFANDILESIRGFSQQIRSKNKKYEKTLENQFEKVENPELLPSAKIMKELEKKSYFEMHLELGKEHSKNFSITEKRENELIEEGIQSWKKQKQIEDADTLDFEAYLKKYFEEIKIQDL